MSRCIAGRYGKIKKAINVNECDICSKGDTNISTLLSFFFFTTY